ncbi:MAG: cytochrome c [Betaproteobacteria bacterium]|nr:MAG: cytochrome c [Betaproteobacteria bacterium]
MALRFLKASLGAAMILGAQAAHAQQPAPAGDAELAHRHKTAMCVGCHGIPGYKTAFPEVYHVPKIAGQQPAYLINALKAYRSGERSHPSMRGIAASLSDQDMADLAAYYGVPAGTAQARGDAESGKAKVTQVCAACHGPDGNRPLTPDQPVIAGQYADYLAKALHDYKTGRRNNPIMKGFAAQLSRQDMEDLAAWFSSQKSRLHDQR